MRRLCAFGAVLHLAVLSALPVAAADRSFSVESKLRGGLGDVIRAAAPGDLIPITIIMSDQASREEVNAAAARPTKVERRAAVIGLLKSRARASQAELLAELSAAQDAGMALDVRGLFLSNLIVAKATPDVILAAAARADVDYVNYDRAAPESIFPFEPGQGGEYPEAPTCGVSLIQAPRVWSELGIRGEGVLVAMIDSGVCITHSDLSNQIWINPGEIPNNGIDDDGNGFIDDVNGWNFANNNKDVSDPIGHGTHTSGTVAGDGAGGTQIGVAPAVDLMMCKVSGNISKESEVWSSMDYAVNNGADLMSASLGWRHAWGPDRPRWRQLCENAIAAGVITIYAAGNEGGGAAPDNVRTPADVPDVLAVGAVDCNKNIAGFSSRGPVTWQNIPPYNDCVPYPPGCRKPAVSAPGVGTISAAVCSGYTTSDGTSMATPHVAGVVALMLSSNPNLLQDDVIQILESTAEDRGVVGPDNDYGAGIVNAYEAVLASGGVDPCEPFKKLNGKCKVNGNLKVTVKFSDNSWDGRKITIAIDGTQYELTVQGDKATFKLCCFTGSHMISLVKPAGCLPDKNVSCP